MQLATQPGWGKQLALVLPGLKLFSACCQLPHLAEVPLHCLSLMKLELHFKVIADSILDTLLSVFMACVLAGQRRSNWLHVEVQGLARQDVGLARQMWLDLANTGKVDVCVLGC